MNTWTTRLTVPNAIVTRPTMSCKARNQGIVSLPGDELRLCGLFDVGAVAFVLPQRHTRTEDGSVMSIGHSQSDEDGTVPDMALASHLLAMGACSIVGI